MLSKNQSRLQSSFPNIFSLKYSSFQGKEKFCENFDQKNSNLTIEKNWENSTKILSSSSSEKGSRRKFLKPKKMTQDKFSEKKLLKRR